MNQNITSCFRSSVENLKDFKELQNNTKGTIEIKIIMCEGKAWNDIIKYELQLHHEGNDEGKNDADKELW